MRSRRFLLALALLWGSGLLFYEPACGPKIALAIPDAPVPVGPKDDRVQRRAIRGGPLDLSRESPELRELRTFEEDSFPRAGLQKSIGQGFGQPLSASGLARPHGEGREALHNGSAEAPEGPHSPPSRPSDGAPDGAESGGAPAEMPTIPWLQALKLLDNLGLSPTFVRFEAHVIRYLEFFKEERRGRSIMASWLRKQGRYRSLIEQTLDRYGLPRFLLYVAMIESGYDPHDRSNKGAVGLWQFLPEGARIYGLRVDYWVDERKDPIHSTEAAARYLGDLKTRFGSWHMALAAFNAGYGAVLRAMQKYNTNDYWELCRHEDGLPWETLLYVPKAIASALVGENRGFFGYEDVVPEPAIQFDTVPVGASLSFDKIAHAVSCTPDDLARLNPELRRNRTPPLTAGESWPLRVPLGTAPQLLAQLDSLRKAEPLTQHIVRFGERIEDLARERGVSASTLRRINGIEDRDSAEVRVGLTLLVPPPNPAYSAPALPPSEALTVVAVPNKSFSVPGKKRVFYRVIPGDTIWAIARFFKVKEADLLRWNNLDPEATLATKMVLDIWVEPDFDTSQVVLVDPARVRVVTTGSDEFFELVETLHGRKRIFHVVKSGETLEHIAKKYHLTVADLERINRLGRQTELRAGEKITVYLPMTESERTAALARLHADSAAPPGSAELAAEPPANADSAPPTDAVPPAEPMPPADPAPPVDPVPPAGRKGSAAEGSPAAPEDPAAAPALPLSALPLPPPAPADDPAAAPPSAPPIDPPPTL